MRHGIRLEGHAFRLRPVRLEDAADILRLRLDPALNRFLHPTSPELSRQEAWLESYFERDGDWCFAVERRADDAFEGAIAIYDLDPSRISAEWGRWVLRSGSLAAVESMLLVHRAAFGPVGLDEVHSRTVVGNEPVVSFHRSSGATLLRTHQNAYTLAEGAVDAVDYGISRRDWPAIERDLDAKARRLAALLDRRPAGAHGDD